MPGKIAHLFLKPGHGEPMQPVASCEAVAGKGILSDASYGRAKRQVLLVEAENLHAFDLSPGDVRENITVEGIRLADLPASTRLQAGEATLEVVAECTPCSVLDDLRPGLMTEIDGLRGMLAKVVAGGTIRLGDSIYVKTLA